MAEGQHLGSDLGVRAGGTAQLEQLTADPFGAPVGSLAPTVAISSPTSESGVVAPNAAAGAPAPEEAPAWAMPAPAPFPGRNTSWWRR
jgi:hypothetical protein